LKLVYYPKISIVTPSFNQAEFLEATILSVLSQNYPNLEYVIIDGGSSDGSVDIIKKYETQLAVWCSEPDLGQYDAVNKGFSHTSGEIMAWINSDDMYYPWAFKTVASVMTDLSQVEWLTTLNLGSWDRYGFCLGFITVPGFSKAAFLDGCYLPFDASTRIGWIQQESTFWRRSLWEKVGSGIPLDFKLAGDFDLWSRFYDFAELYGIDSPLGGFRFQNHQKTKSREAYCSEAYVSLERMRKHNRWKFNWKRKLVKNIRIERTPKFGKYFKETFSYSGRKVVREDFGSLNAFWKDVKYDFD